MALTKKDLQAIRTLIREETQPEFKAIREALEYAVQEMTTFTGDLHKDLEKRVYKLEEGACE